MLCIARHNVLPSHWVLPKHPSRLADWQFWSLLWFAIAAQRSRPGLSGFPKYPNPSKILLAYTPAQYHSHIQ